MRWIAIILLLLFAQAAPVTAAEQLRELTGIVTKVENGDTIYVVSVGVLLKVQLGGIDAPIMEQTDAATGKIIKPGQPFSDTAKSALQEKVQGKHVRLELLDYDKYQQVAAIVWLHGRNINREMVAEGLAWTRRKYLNAHYGNDFSVAEAEARQSRLGLWEQEAPQPPWEYEKQHKTDKTGHHNDKITDCPK